ncbi:MAG: Rv3654c family TadE-like protein [Stackebrandtia sp.]
MRVRCRRRERGSASILMLGIGMAALLFAAGGVLLGAAVEARHRAQVGADAAALAGAMRAVEGETVACERAAELAEANETRLLECELSGMDVVVEAAAPTAAAPAGFGPATATARAGPVENAEGVVAPGS